MSNIKKINQNYPKDAHIGENDIYRKFNEQFESLFNAKEPARDNEEFANNYIQDIDFEEQIDRFRNAKMDMTKFCVGYTGIGKTTTLRHCFNLGIRKSSAYINPERKEIILPTFLDGYHKYDQESFDLIPRISSACIELEEIHPELKILLSTKEGKEEFYYFMRENTGFALEDTSPVIAMNLNREELIKMRLENAYSRYPYEYQANRLKFYIMKNYNHYQQLIILLDDIESLPELFQQEVISKFCKFQDCMLNTQFNKDATYNVKLLISVRPHTYRIFQGNRRIEAFHIYCPPITKDKPLDLNAFFKARLDFYTQKSSKEIGNIVTWKECYDKLVKMNMGFDGKYKKMILNLCFFNVRESLTAYARVFANRRWIQKNKIKEEAFTIAINDYSFNNISVVRALACNENIVFQGDCDQLIPNIFYTTESIDLSMHCLLVIQYFYKKRNNDIYGYNVKKVKDIKKDWNGIFSKKVTENLIYAMNFLFLQKVLRKSIKDIDDLNTIDTIESLNEESMLYISPRGCELYDMLQDDSVLLELLREDVWRDYSNRKSYSDLVVLS